MKAIHATILLSLLFVLLLFAPPAAAQATAVLDYPRTVDGEVFEARIHHPVIDRWGDYETLEAWVPVEVIERSSGDSWVGAVRAAADTTVLLDERKVLLGKRQITDARFSDPATPQAAIAFARSALGTGRQEVTLDEVLLSLAEDFEPPVDRPDPGFRRTPPRIEVHTGPVTVVLIDQEPVQAPIQGTALEVVVNTDLDLFFHTVGGGTWYLLNEGNWQRSSLLASGAWETADRLPEDFRRLTGNERWAAVQAALPPGQTSADLPPVLISLEPLALIAIDGEPVLQAIPGAGGLAEVANTQSDLFRLDERWYYLASGRWFESEQLSGPWEAVEHLPGAFAAIPADHGRAAVRASIPGTMESAIAYLAATLPQRKVVPLDAAPAQTVVYVGEPRFEPIAQTQVERAVNTPFAVLRHNNRYYLNYEAAWYGSENPLGPWKPAIVVPDELFEIPPSDPLHYVTYVRPAGNQPVSGEARFSYTEGYNGMYTIGRAAVRGTGWNYSPWIGYPGGAPVYWGYPRTYWGYGWGHPAYYWGAYAPMQSVTVDGPERMPGGAPSITEQDPRLTRPGYDYTTLTQQRLEASRAAGYADDDLFADSQGQVYRRSEEGWARHEESGWSTMAELERQYGVDNSGPSTLPPADRQRQAYRQNPDDAERMERYYDRRSKSYNSYMNIYVPR